VPVWDYGASFTSVRLITEQIQLVIWAERGFCGVGLTKQLIDRHFLECGDAEQLQDCVESGLEDEAFIDDRDEHIDAYGDPDLGLHRILAGAEEAFDARPPQAPL
jgi:hypothetical protein